MKNAKNTHFELGFDYFVFEKDYFLITFDLVLLYSKILKVRKSCGGGVHTRVVTKLLDDLFF